MNPRQWSLAKQRTPPTRTTPQDAQGGIPGVYSVFLEKNQTRDILITVWILGWMEWQKDKKNFMSDQ